MTGFFRDLISAEPRSIDEIRSSLDQYEEDEMDFFSILREHHEDLKDSISILMANSPLNAPDAAEKHTHLFRFLRMLEMHGKAEQETLYVNLKSSVEADARLEGHAGQNEHDIAFQLEFELQQMGCSFSWSEAVAAKSRVLAGLVLNHIKEEEREMFAIAEKSLSPSLLRRMTHDYLLKCRLYLDDSDVFTDILIENGAVFGNPGWGELEVECGQGPEPAKFWADDSAIGLRDPSRSPEDPLSDARGDVIRS